VRNLAIAEVEAKLESGRPVTVKLLPSAPRQWLDSTLSTPLHVDESSQCCEVSSHENEWQVTPEATKHRPLCAIVLWLVVFNLAKIRSSDLSI
jgi:hypothetical protein